MLAGTSGLHAVEANYRVIPLPGSIRLEKTTGFTLNEKTKIVYPKGNDKMKRNAEFLSEYLQQETGKKLSTSTSGSKNAIVLKIKTVKNSNQERYQLTVSKNDITIEGGSEAGVFYGIQTLRKATPIGQSNVIYPAVKITDQPRFGYRGMHLDVGRHFMPAEFIKKYIDILALHNMNTFHWHLTEDQGWRIEIKKYPKLTEVGAWRSETVVGHNSGKFDGKPHGGFYTQDQIRDIVKYAADRHITIIPEIDLPGHMLAALASYPELGCTGGPYEVEKTWGVFDDVLCAGQEKTYTFLEDVLTEVCDLFPSKYIHIGGDESPKVRWEKCPRCQAKIKELGLKDDAKHKKEFYLQSYVTERIEKFLNGKGRQIIGWDEILEGKLAPNATVMSWRGEAGGIEAARLGHDVIMTPNSYLYFDYYQSADTKNEPDAIGGFLPIERVYNYEPMSKELTPAEQKHILGAQANIWTEYIPTPQQVEYMAMPRMAALAEVQWTQPDKKNYGDFLNRIPRLLKIYDLLGYNYATHIFDVKTELKPNTNKGTLDISLSTLDNAPIYYTLDGSEPTVNSTKYNGTVSLDKNATIKAKAIRANGKNSRTFSENILLSKSSLKPIKLLTTPEKSYTYTGASLLNDGLRGTDTNYKTGRWMGFQANDLVAVIDLEKPTEISKASVQTCVNTGDWILDAKNFKISVSDDGVNYKFIAGIETDPNTKTTHWQGIMNHTLIFPALTTRYVKATVGRFTEFPKWHGAHGNAYVFVDEISLY
ncbi:MAG: glycoside hydrolase family 20 protein [Paludibacteraceae bacterium]